MKAKHVISIIVMLTLFVSVAACSGIQKLDDPTLSADIIIDYTQGEEGHTEVFPSEGWENGEPFNTWWSSDCVSYNYNKLALTVAPMTEKEQAWNAETERFEDCISNYYGGETRTKSYYGYGDFEVRMKPSNVKGTASTFFTCTGPYDQWYENGEVVKQNHHDEIDIEFLGKNPRKLQFNYFANGVGGHEHMIDLGFDASEDFHNYGFRWTEESITWFVDGKPVYKVYRKDIKKGESWPEEPGRILTNYWVGTRKAAAWMGTFDGDYSGQAEYQWIRTSAAPQIDPNTTKDENHGGETNEMPTDIAWDDATLIPFMSQDVYTVTSDEAAKTVTVEYTQAKKNSYSNTSAAVTAEGKNYVHMTLTSKTDKDISARVNVRGADGDIVSQAYVSKGSVSIDGGAMLTVPANDSVEVVIYFEGAVSSIELMLDSTWAAAANENANVLEVSDMRFGVKGEVVGPKPTLNNGVKIGDATVKFVGGGYEMISSEDLSSLTVKYADLSGKSYANINGYIGDIVGENDTFGFKVKNNGTETAKIRIDIDCNAGEGTPLNSEGGKNNFCNISCTAEGIVAQGNDYQYTGGDWIQIAAGQEATVSIKFITGVGAKSVTMFIDSSTWDDEGTHTGEIVLSDLTLTKSEGGNGEQGDEEMLVPGEESSAINNKYIYWYVQDASWGCGSAVTMNTAKYEDGVVTLSYVGGSVNYSVQLFYKNTAFEKGKTYKVTLKLNASVAGEVTVNGQVKAVVAGDNEIEVEFVLGTPTYDGDTIGISALDIQFWGGEAEVTYQVSNVNWEAVESGDNGDNGGSDPEYNFEGGATYTVASDAELVWGSEGDGANNTLIYWHVQDASWGCGSVVTMNTKKYENGAVTLAYVGGSVNYSVQLFYKNTEMQNGKVYKVNLKINASVAATCRVNGKSVALVAGDNDVEAVFTLANASGVSALDIQFNGSDSEVTYVVSDILWTAAVEKTQEQPELKVPEGATAVSLSSFDGWGSYSVTSNETSATISHNSAFSAYQYACCGANPLNVGNNNTLMFTVTNNGEETAELRFDLKNDVSGAYGMVSATVNGEAVVLGQDDKGNNVLVMNVAKGQTVTVVITLNTEANVDCMVLFFDDMKEENPQAGSITIANAYAYNLTQE